MANDVEGVANDVEGVANCVGGVANQAMRRVAVVFLSSFASTGASTFHSLAQNSDMPSFGSLATASTANFGSQSSQAGCGFGTQAEGFGDQSSAFGGGSGK